MEQLDCQNVDSERKPTEASAGQQPDQVEVCKLSASFLVRLVTSLNMAVLTPAVRWLRDAARRCVGPLFGARKAEETAEAPGNCGAFAIIYVCHHLVARPNCPLARSSAADEQPRDAVSSPKPDGTKGETNNNCSKSDDEQAASESIRDDVSVGEEEPDVIDSLVCEPSDLTSQSTPLFPSNGTWKFDELEENLNRDVGQLD